MSFVLLYSVMVLQQTLSISGSIAPAVTDPVAKAYIGGLAPWNVQRANKLFSWWGYIKVHCKTVLVTKKVCVTGMYYKTVRVTKQYSYTKWDKVQNSRSQKVNFT